MTKINRNTILLIIIFLGIFGAIESSIITYAKYNNQVSYICGGDEPTNSCNTVQTSEYGYFINYTSESGTKIQVPFTLAGIFFYIIISIMAFLYWKKNKEKKKISKCFKNLFLLLAITGTIFSGIFTWIQGYLIKAYCSYCLVSAINTVVILTLVIYMLYKK